MAAPNESTEKHLKFEITCVLLQCEKGSFTNAIKLSLGLKTDYYKFREILNIFLIRKENLKRQSIYSSLSNIDDFTFDLIAFFPTPLLPIKAILQGVSSQGLCHRCYIF